MDEGFVESATKDLLQPILVRPVGEGRYEVVMGHRRWFAFKRKNLPVPCRVRDMDDKEALWQPYKENADRLELDEVEEVEHILRLINVELKGTPEYAECGNDPKKAVTIAYEVKIGQMPKKIIRNVTNNLATRLDAFFERLPRSRSLSVRSFYEYKLPLLRIPEGFHEELRRKEVRSSAEIAIAKVDDEYARKALIDWTKAKSKIPPVRMLDKRACLLNKVAGKLPLVSEEGREHIVNLILEKAPSPRQLDLEMLRWLPQPEGSEAAQARLRERQIFCLGDSAHMDAVEDESVRLVIGSPPYLDCIPFPGDYLSCAMDPDEYFKLAEPIVAECFRVLMPAGKFVLNWGEPIGKGEGVNYDEGIYIHRWYDIAKRVGFQAWGKVIWCKNIFYANARDRVRPEDACHLDGRFHLNWEWLVIFRKPGPRPEDLKALDYDFWGKELSSGVWHISGAQRVKEFAVFPDELVRRFVELYTIPGDIVLDPFLGTGTTVKVARRMGRVGVGYEIRGEMAETIEMELEKGLKSDRDQPSGELSSRNLTFAS